MSSANSLNSPKVWTALITPFTKSGLIDIDQLLMLIERQAQVRNGVLLLGSTGESLALSFSERVQVIEQVMASKPTAQVMVGVGGFHLAQTSQWINILNTYELAALLLVTPIYAKPGVMGQVAWFEALLDQAKHPCMLYHIPSRAGSPLYRAAVDQLVNHPNFTSVKVSGDGDFSGLRSIQLYSGDDGHFPQQVDAAGLVSVASNVWPQGISDYVNKVLNGTWSDFDQQQLQPIFESLTQASNPIPVKALLHDLQITKTDILRPPLSIKDLPNRQALYHSHKQFMKWHEAQ